MEKLCKSFRYLLLGIAALGVAACAGGSADLLEYIDDVKARPGGRIEPLPQIKPYDTFAYQASDLRSPFMPDQPNAPGNIAGPHPVENRNKEYLEQFPLDTLDMVGTLDRSGKTFALVQTLDGLVHRVIAGNYLGQNDGRVIAISDAEISLEELVSDGIGGFFKRSAAIGLSD
ncbi:MAG: pilus assembly protein PilP [Gammaproteobacteria bacterium]